MIFTIFLSLGLIITSSALFISVKKNLEFMEKIEEVSESLQTSLDILEQQFQTIEKKSKIELFSDEPIVKELVEDISIAKNSIMMTAIILDGVLREDQENNKEND